MLEKKCVKFRQLFQKGSNFFKPFTSITSLKSYYFSHLFSSALVLGRKAKPAATAAWLIVAR